MTRSLEQKEAKPIKIRDGNIFDGKILRGCGIRPIPHASDVQDVFAALSFSKGFELVPPADEVLHEGDVAIFDSAELMGCVGKIVHGDLPQDRIHAGAAFRPITDGLRAS